MATRSDRLLAADVPKQTNTNKQIEQINDMFGVNFDTWTTSRTSVSVASILAGLSEVEGGHRNRLQPRGIDDEATVETEAVRDPAFEQTYSVYTTSSSRPLSACPTCRVVVPFCVGGIGVAYEKDTTSCRSETNTSTSTCRSTTTGSSDVHRRDRNRQLRVRYVQLVPGARSVLRPGPSSTNGRGGGLARAPPEVRADQDSTGPSWWIGVGKRF